MAHRAVQPRAAGERGLIALAGSIAQRPGYAGHAWLFLQYVFGFRKLGWEVIFLDRLDDEMVAASAEAGVEPHLSWFRHVMRYGEVANYSLAMPHGKRVGIQPVRLRSLLREADLLLDVNGFAGDDELSGLVRRKVFLDIDPGFNQMWYTLGLACNLGRHDAYASYAQRIGQPGCRIPTCGLSWIPTAAPVSTELWTAVPPAPDAPLTSVATWRGPFGPVEYEGQRYGLRVHEFRRLAAIAQSKRAKFEIALEIDADDASDREALEGYGWRTVDPPQVVGDLNTYRSYISGSKAEFGVAKEMYVRTRSGWVSDRTICYLASGRPALVQDTGLSDVMPPSDGLLLFSTLADAERQLDDLLDRYAAHCAGARQLALSTFSPEIVLGALMDDVNRTANARRDQ